MPEILEFKPIGLEGFEGSIVDGLRRKGAPHLELLPEGRRLPAGGIWLGRSSARRSDCAQQLIERLKQSPDPPDMRLYTKSEARACLANSRSRAARGRRFAPGAPPEWEGWDDAAVAPEKLGAYLRDIRKLLNEYDYHAAFYGHFGHGCIHMRVSFDLAERRREFASTANSSSAPRIWW